VGRDSGIFRLIIFFHLTAELQRPPKAKGNIGIIRIVDIFQCFVPLESCALKLDSLLNCVVEYDSNELFVRPRWKMTLHDNSGCKRGPSEKRLFVSYFLFSDVLSTQRLRLRTTFDRTEFNN